MYLSYCILKFKTEIEKIISVVEVGNTGVRFDFLCALDGDTAKGGGFFLSNFEHSHIFGVGGVHRHGLGLYPRFKLKYDVPKKLCIYERSVEAIKISSAKTMGNRLLFVSRNSKIKSLFGVFGSYICETPFVNWAYTKKVKWSHLHKNSIFDNRLIFR